MKVSFLDYTKKKIITLQKDYLEDVLEIEEAINDFSKELENTDHLRDWLIFIASTPKIGSSTTDFQFYDYVGEYLDRIEKDKVERIYWENYFTSKDI